MNHIKNMIKMIRELQGKYDTWIIYSDFLEMAAISINNSISTIRCENKERRYLEITKKYTASELDTFGKLLGALVLALEEEPTDVLGRIFMEMELGNSWKGQFFTPMSICSLMARLTVGNKIEAIEKDGFVTVSEPACGGGATIIGLALALKEHGYNYQKQMVVSGVDLDIRSVYMAYIQLSLLGIPARVAHGNTLTVEVFEEWFTPMYIFGGWSYTTRTQKNALLQYVPIKELQQVSCM